MSRKNDSIPKMKKIHPGQADGSSRLETKRPRLHSVLTGTGNMVTQNVEKGNMVSHYVATINRVSSFRELKSMLVAVFLR